MMGLTVGLVTLALVVTTGALKLEPDPRRPHYLLTEVGLGCRLKLE